MPDSPDHDTEERSNGAPPAAVHEALRRAGSQSGGNSKPAERDRPATKPPGDGRTAEEALQASEEQFRRAIEDAPIPMIMQAEDGQVLEISKTWTALTGYTTEDIPRFDAWLNRAYGIGADEVRNRIQRVFRGESKMEQLDFEIVTKSGERRHWNFSAFAPGTLRDGRRFVIGMALDITERKQAEGAWRESKERFRQFAENSDDVLWIIDAKRQQFEYLSPAFEQVWGESRDAIGQDLVRWGELLHPDDREKTLASLPRLLAGETILREYRIVRPDDGSVRWIRDTGFPVRHENGEVCRVAGIAQDITADKNRSAALLGSEERFRLLVEGARDYAMFLIDPGNIITFWSSGAERVFGWTQEEAVGQRGEMIFTPEDRARGEVEREIETALTAGRAPDRRFHLRKDGSRFWTDGVLMRLDDQHKTLRGFAKVARDATDQRRIEDELVRARDEMEQRVVERTADLLATNKELERAMAQREQLEHQLLEISEREKRRIGEDLHDMVCQELTATALFLKSSANKVERESKAAAETLNESAQIVNRNVNLARDLARGLQPAEMSASGLNTALRALAEQARENRHITCEFRPGRNVRLRDDTIALHLYRIAQEGVTNALQHSGAQNVVISLDRDGGEICLAVGDDGKGLSTRKKHKGLGLHIMKYRANVLGGTLHIDSGKRGGTTITASIPAKR